MSSKRALLFFVAKLDSNTSAPVLHPRLFFWVSLRVRHQLSVWARLAESQDGKLPFHQGHLWGKGLAAGGRRLEDASDARPAREPGCVLLGCQGVGFLCLRRSYHMPLITVVTGVSRDLCVYVDSNLIIH